MKNLAPKLIRQKLLIEGFYKIDVNLDAVKSYLKKVIEALDLQVYGEPLIFSHEVEAGGENYGYDAIVPLISSGISIYVWSSSEFLSLIIYNCKSFDENKIIGLTKEFWKIDEMESLLF